MHPIFPGSNPILPVYAGKMGILRVKRDSPYLAKPNDVNKKQCHALLCLGLFGRYTTNCYPNARNVGATNSGTLTVPYCPGLPYIPPVTVNIIHIVIDLVFVNASDVTGGQRGAEVSFVTEGAAHQRVHER